MILDNDTWNMASRACPELEWQNTKSTAATLKINYQGMKLNKTSLGSLVAEEGRERVGKAVCS